MKREIKFRGWNEDSKKMIDLHAITPLALSDSMNTQLALQCMDGLFLPFSDRIKLMQFTGLKDKNGKDIYEGDILKITMDNGYSEIGQIFYKEITARFCFLSPDEEAYGLKTNDSHNEVIGDIYENPELLK